MKSLLDEALATVDRARREVDGLVRQAVEMRRYEELAKIAELAASLSRTLTHGSGREADTTEVGKAAAAESKARSRARPRRRTGPMRTSREQAVGSRQLDGTKRDTEYPRFIRDGSTLVKIGWSRSSGSTYEHRASRAVLDAVAQRALALADSDERPFTAEALSDVGKHDDGLNMPGYQLYLCLGWLRRTGLVAQRGRKGYVVPRPRSFADDLEQAWESLTSDTRGADTVSTE